MTHIMMKYPKVLEVGPIAPPHAGWSVRMHYVLEAMRDEGLECQALDIGPMRKVKRPHCDHAPSGLSYVTKIFSYLWRGYRLHHHLNGDSVKAYVLVLIGCLLSWCFGRPAILTWHGGVPQKWFPKGRNRFADLVHAWIFALCEHIVCNDEKIKTYLLEYGLPSDKVVPIPAFSRQYLRFERATLPTELERFLAAHTPRFFCYAYDRPEFQLPVLVAALQQLAEKLPGYGLVFVGDAKEAGGIRAAIEAAGLLSHVYFAGDQSREGFLSIVTQCDLMIRTPIRDGVSSSVLEALGLGVPVVAAANALRPKQVTQYPGDDAQALAAAVLQVLALDPEARRPQGVVIPDTVQDEVRLLTGAVPSAVCQAS